LVFIIFIGCKSQLYKEPEMKPVLECVLDSYIEHFSINKEKALYVRDGHSLTDSTSQIRIMSISKKRSLMSGEMFYSKYKGIDVFLVYGDSQSFTDTFKLNEMDLSNLISNNIEWNVRNFPIPKKDTDEIMVSQGEYFELRLIYNHKSRCLNIDSSSQYLVELKNLITKSCYICR